MLFYHISIQYYCYCSAFSHQTKINSITHFNIYRKNLRWLGRIEGWRKSKFDVLIWYFSSICFYVRIHHVPRDWYSIFFRFEMRPYWLTDSYAWSVRTIKIHSLWFNERHCYRCNRLTLFLPFFFFFQNTHICLRIEISVINERRCGFLAYFFFPFKWLMFTNQSKLRHTLCFRNNYQTKYNLLFQKEEDKIIVSPFSFYIFWYHLVLSPIGSMTKSDLYTLNLPTNQTNSTYFLWFF